MNPKVPYIRNGQTISLKDLSPLPENLFAQTLSEMLSEGRRLCAYFGSLSSAGQIDLWAVCADDVQGLLYLLWGKGYRDLLLKVWPGMPIKM